MCSQDSMLGGSRKYTCADDTCPVSGCCALSMWANLVYVEPHVLIRG